MNKILEKHLILYSLDVIIDVLYTFGALRLRNSLLFIEKKG